MKKKTVSKRFLFAALFLASCFANPARAGTEDVRKVVLDNGLTVLLKELHAAPVASINLWYKVGSRNEVPGKTGLAHLLEHMMFKGSANWPAGEMDAAIKRMGGDNNAGTSNDYTVYYAEVPSDKLPQVIEMEADRMSGALLGDGEFKEELNVVMEERKMRNEDSATGLFWEEINAAAFKVHSYGAPVIGWMRDLERMTIEDARNFYKTYYAPNNAVLVLSGDFDAEDVLKKVKETFGALPSTGAPPVFSIREPEQAARREVRYETDKSDLAHLVYAHHSPAMSDDRAPALEILAEILSGGRESRLEKALVETGLASSASAVYDTNADPYLFYFQVEALPGADLGRIEKALDEQIEKTLSEPATDYELQKARNRFSAQEIMSSQTARSYGFKLGWYELATGDYRNLDGYLKRIDEVKADDILAAARSVFKDANRTVGRLIPKAGAGAGAPAPASGMIHRSFDGEETASDARGSGGGAVSTRERLSDRIRDVRLANGMRLLVLENPAFPVVSMSVSAAGAGAYTDPDGKSGAAALTAAVLRRGTTNRSYEEINRALEFVGAELDLSAGNETAEASYQALSRDFELGVEILADLFRNPLFPEDGFRKEKDLAVAAAVASAKNNRDEAWARYNEAVYQGHPYGHRPNGRKEELEAMTLQDVKAFHALRFRPDQVILAVVGDVGFEKVKALVEKAFGGWANPAAPPFSIAPVPPMSQGAVVDATMPEKTQCVVYLGWPSISRGDPDYYKADLMNFILGGGGFGSRLVERVRERNGLAYYVYSRLHAKSEGGSFFVNMGVSPENVDRALELTGNELERMKSELVSEKELSDAVAYKTGNQPLELQSAADLAKAIASYAYFNVPFSDLDDYRKRYESVTREDIRAAAEAYLRPEAAVRVVAGPWKDGKPLTHPDEARE